jgi:hypothetical protein
MILDKEQMFSDGQAVTASAASTNHIDLGALNDIGVGEPLEVLFVAPEAAESAGASTLVIALETDSQPSFATKVTLAQSGVIAKSAITAGAELWRPKVPAGVQRYLRAFYTVAVADFTAGTFTAGLVLDRPAHAYPPRGDHVDGF